ncbi:contractile injection system protein, VgrG/Pvc8 family, partial [uncultured Desulfovibrio sp.]|uniref:contractile injection system protein, VgrG/Pvc8 family n=1 Tax=uncultured Desulfovibrio sp. TaxID=167968 RepID=UPI0026361624
MAFNGMYANRHWFTCGIDAGGGEPENLDVYAFHGREQVSDGYIFNIEAVTRRANVDIPRLLGCPCHLDITDKSGGTRHLHGLVRQMKQMHTANSVTHYLLEVTPRLYFLKKTQDHRIYQHMTVPDIIQQVLNKHGFPEEAYIFQLRDKYPKREYCTQYGESDYHFICRLAEEEG